MGRALARGRLRGHRGDLCRQAVALRFLAWHALPAVAGHRPRRGRHLEQRSRPGALRREQCYEHMSDMLCRFSNARIIHRSDARVVVHWRNASASIDYRGPRWTRTVGASGPTNTGRSIRTAFPSGTSWCITTPTRPITAELNQNEILCHPGQATEDVMHDDGGDPRQPGWPNPTIRRTSPPAKKGEGDWNLQLINLKGQTKQFEIGEIGAYERDVFAPRRLVARLESLSRATDSERRHAREHLRPSVVHVPGHLS